MCFPASARLQLALPITVTRHRHVRVSFQPIRGVLAVAAQHVHAFASTSKLRSSDPASGETPSSTETALERLGGCSPHPRIAFSHTLCVFMSQQTSDLLLVVILVMIFCISDMLYELKPEWMGYENGRLPRKSKSGDRAAVGALRQPCVSEARTDTALPARKQSSKRVYVPYSVAPCGPAIM